MSPLWKYSVTFKQTSGQPEIPWGVIKTLTPLVNAWDMGLLYIDGYYLTWGGGETVEGRRAAALRHATEKNRWENPGESDGNYYKSGAVPELSNLSLEDLSKKLETFGGDWEQNWVVPYIQGLLDAERMKLQINALLAEEPS